MTNSIIQKSKELERIKSIERSIMFGDMTKEDLSPEDRKNLEAYQEESRQDLIRFKESLEALRNPK